MLHYVRAYHVPIVEHLRWSPRLHWQTPTPEADLPGGHVCSWNLSSPVYASHIQNRKGVHLQLRFLVAAERLPLSRISSHCAVLNSSNLMIWWNSGEDISSPLKVCGRFSNLFPFRNLNPRPSSSVKPSSKLARSHYRLAPCSSLRLWCNASFEEPCVPFLNQGLWKIWLHSL